MPSFGFKACTIGMCLAQGIVIAGALRAPPVAAGSVAGNTSYETRQHRRLFAPTEAEISAEARGRVEIYDGMKDSEVESAISEQFDRVESMMFIRTRITDTNGEVTGYEEDGCD